VVEQLGVVLVDEGGDALVGDEAQDVVDGAAGGVDVAPSRQLVDARPDVAQERGPVGGRLVLGRGLEAAQVRGDRELHVHVEEEALREEEGDVGDGAVRQGPLPHVAHALHEPGGSQHVVGHALAPLAPHLRVGEGLAQRGGRRAEIARLPGGGCDLLAELPVVTGTLPLDAHDGGAERLEARRHGGELLTEDGRGPVRPRRLTGAGPGELGGEDGGDHDQHEDGGDEEELHGRSMITGCDSGGDATADGTGARRGGESTDAQLGASSARS
jgi:hypothetical protein